MKLGNQDIISIVLGIQITQESRTNNNVTSEIN